MLVAGERCNRAASTWHAGWLKQGGFQPRRKHFTVMFERISGQMPIGQLKDVELPCPMKQVLFLPELESEADAHNVDTLPLLREAPHAVWSMVVSPIGGLSSQTVRLPPPPTTPLSMRERELVQEARSKTGLVRMWSDSIPLDEHTFSRLSTVPNDPISQSSREFHLKDEEINAFAGMLNRACPRGYCFVMSSHIYIALEAGNDETVERLLRAAPLCEDLLNKEQLLFMVNVPRSATSAGHWYLLQAHITGGHIAALDSWPGAHPDALTIVQAFVERLDRDVAERARQARTSPFTENWRSAARLQGHGQTPRQTDAVSCGIYMLIAMWCCMSAVDPNAYLGGALTANYWRARVTLILYTGSLFDHPLHRVPRAAHMHRGMSVALSS